MKLHEYQAKQLFQSVGIPVPRGVVATTPDQAAGNYEALKRQCGGGEAFPCNVKAQLHAGGRGKAGGVLVAHSAQEASAHAAALLGRRLVTKQTGPDGLPISAVLLDERIAVARELYLALTIDRFNARPIALASHCGGVDIEEVAASRPQAILREGIDTVDALQDASLSRIAETLGCTPEQTEACGQIVQAMWRLFESTDASLIEINPLVVTDDGLPAAPASTGKGAAQAGRLMALDAKVTLDDNALFRHPDLAAWRDESQEQPLELRAGRIGISYVGLDGTIGCLVNGAGLAMATNDIIKLSGGSPANFLDVGGGANIEQVTNAFAIILADPRVRAILVNIFGGIMRCDWIAQGLLNATQQFEVKLPIVVRLQGTNVEEGRRLLAGAARLNLISVDELADAARRAVLLSRT
ncbi:MAG: ADP-forming succinate--CoA ligase subunit beta [Candidatus Omnitrophica bacterium]|nr:ADP-forming succinate--CoA ligase subunit beta [Candidatus Omnitrophota bacterium]